MDTSQLTAHIRKNSETTDIKQRLQQELEVWQQCQAAVQGLLSECSHILRSGKTREMSVHLASLDQAYQKERLAAQAYQMTVEKMTNYRAQ